MASDTFHHVPWTLSHCLLQRGSLLHTPTTVSQSCQWQWIIINCMDFGLICEGMYVCFFREQFTATLSKPAFIENLLREAEPSVGGWCQLSSVCHLHICWGCVFNSFVLLLLWTVWSFSATTAGHSERLASDVSRETCLVCGSCQRLSVKQHDEQVKLDGKRPQQQFYHRGFGGNNNLL